MGREARSVARMREDARHDTDARDVELFPHHGLEA